MRTLSKTLTGLAALAFALGVVTSLTGPLWIIRPVTYSRACTNLALLAIAIVLTFGDKVHRQRPVDLP